MTRVCWTFRDRGVLYLAWHCPGCKASHAVPLDRWQWNGDSKLPTVTPSLISGPEQRKCHSIVSGGKVLFLTDCWHELAGKTAAMVCR